MKKTFVLLFGLIMLSCSINPCGPKLKLRVFVPPLSKHARTMLCKYDDYVIHDIVFEMMLSDVERVVGELPRSTRYEQVIPENPIFDYKNLILIGYSERSQGQDQIRRIAVVSGKYLGLTIGQSSKTDADRMFGRKALDRYEYARFDDADGTAEEDPKYMRSVYRDRDGAIVVVYYENDVVTTITVAKEMGV